MAMIWWMRFRKMTMHEKYVRYCECGSMMAGTTNVVSCTMEKNFISWYIGPSRAVGRVPSLNHPSPFGHFVPRAIWYGCMRNPT